MNKSGVDIRFAKSKEYKNVLTNIIKTDKCPFCPDNFKYHKNLILKKHQGWIATANSWPYKDTKHHFLFIPNKHLTQFSDLTVKDLKAVKDLIDWIVAKYKIKGGGVTLRFGEQKYTGATVSHLHFHLIVPKLDSKTKTAKVINFPIG